MAITNKYLWFRWALNRLHDIFEVLKIIPIFNNNICILPTCFCQCKLSTPVIKSFRNRILRNLCYSIKKYMGEEKALSSLTLLHKQICCTIYCSHHKGLLTFFVVVVFFYSDNIWENGSEDYFNCGESHFDVIVKLVLCCIFYMLFLIVVERFSHYKGWYQNKEMNVNIHCWKISILRRLISKLKEVYSCNPSFTLTIDISGGMGLTYF